MANENMPAFESLVGLQKMADSIGDPFQKVEQVKKALGFMAARKLLDHQYMVNANLVLASKADMPPMELLKFSDGLFFVGLLDAYSYMLDPDLPMDSLALNFKQPDVIGILPEEVEAFKSLQLRVPVLAIDTFVSAEAA